jgi:hypothetical protein
MTPIDENFRPLAARSATYNIAAAAAVKAGPGRLIRISVVTVGSTAGTINDCAATGDAAIGNQIGSIPTTWVAGTVVEFDWPCSTGITIVPGTSGVLAVSFS